MPRPLRCALTQVEHSQRKGRRREEPPGPHAVSFVTAVLMAIALCFHSVLEVSHPVAKVPFFTCSYPGQHTLPAAIHATSCDADVRRKLK